jgi:transcriptional regulator with XRE-family HTH domain
MKNKLEHYRLKLSAERGRIITQKEFAEYLGVNYSQYNSWAKQRRNPSADNFIKIARALNVKVEDLIDGNS